MSIFICGVNQFAFVTYSIEQQEQSIQIVSMIEFNENEKTIFSWPRRCSKDQLALFERSSRAVSCDIIHLAEMNTLYAFPFLCCPADRSCRLQTSANKQNTKII